MLKDERKPLWPPGPRSTGVEMRRMTIQTKLLSFLTVILVAILGAYTVVNVVRTDLLLRSSDARGQEALEHAMRSQASSVFTSFEKGARRSLMQGEMDEFQLLLEDLVQVENVLEIGLTGDTGELLYSAAPQGRANGLDRAEFASSVQARGETTLESDPGSVHVSRAYLLDEQCLDCHDGTPGDLSGVLYVRYDTSSLDALHAENTTFAAQTRRNSILQSALIGILALILTLGGTVYLVRRVICAPLGTLIHRAREMASGQADLTARIESRSNDELNDLADAFNAFIEKIRVAVKSVTDKTGQLASASHMLSNVSETVTRTAQETAQQVQRVTAASRGIDDSMQMVAVASEEMNATIHEVARNASEAYEVARQAVEVTENSASSSAQLSESSSAIGAVVKVIDDIAEQTNLLALNATIEAARAGEAGKGFAVVASEVKELASQTGKATEDIQRRVKGIQVDSRAGVEAMESIRAIVRRINEIADMISSAMTEQSATTAEIAKNTGQAASNTRDITQNINAVAEAAQRTLQSTQEISAATSQVMQSMREIERDLATFKV